MLSRSPGRRAGDDRGAITAEFAVALPAVALVLAFVLGGIELAGEQLRLQEAAFDAARLLGRGESGAPQRIHDVSPAATVSSSRSGPAICADATAPIALGVLSGIVLRATACALDDASP